MLNVFDDIIVGAFFFSFISITIKKVSIVFYDKQQTQCMTLFGVKERTKKSKKRYNTIIK